MKHNKDNMIAAVDAEEEDYSAAAHEDLQNRFSD